jgi:hypothetical protein
MKYVLIIFLYFFVLKSYSKKYPGEYYINNNDTISCRIDVGENFNYDDLINPLTCKYTVCIYETDSLKVFKAYQIKGFCIKNPTYGDQFFTSITYKKENIFVQKLVEGRLSVYLYFYMNSYDWSCEQRYMLKKGVNYTAIPLLLFKTSYAPLVQDNQEIYNKVMKGTYKSKDIVEVTRLYNSSF